MDKNECEDIYSETETEEHLNGKRDLFEWIKKQPSITDAVLEGWIPETKQRPDIMFKFNGKQYVIEYQCSPIATEWIERHELYQASGIIDIWILGIEKYLKPNMREKFIQKYAVAFYDSSLKLIVINFKDFLALDKNNGKFIVKKYQHQSDIFCGFKLKDFIFNNGNVEHKLFFNMKFSKEIHNERCNKKIAYEKKKKSRLELKAKNIINTVKKNTTFNYGYYNIQSVKRNNKNVYLYANDLKRIDVLNIFLLSIENNNWEFSIDLKRGKYTLSAKPKVQALYNEHFTKKIFYSSDLIKYCQNIELFKSELCKLMKNNKSLALNFNKDKNIRILEVQ